MTGDAPTLPDEIESLERFIRPFLDRLARTPYLRGDNARKLLEEVAYYLWRNGPTGAATLVEWIAASGLLDLPPELGDAERRAIITQLIGNSGIVVTEDGDFRFACQTVQKYLAACHIVGRYPRGPR